MTSFDFWSAWLLAVSALFALVGLWVAIAPEGQKPGDAQAAQLKSKPLSPKNRCRWPDPV